MFWEVFTHEYFWLSFLPISFLGAGFWLLFFERVREQKDPIGQLFLAMGAGFLSTVAYASFGTLFGIESFLAQVWWEEWFKVMAAIVAMELFDKRFKTVAGGVVYGFAVGLGFAMAENLVYLTKIYSMTEFNADFWLTWQGRFWSSTILHGVTTALFGLFYASAYLSKTINKKANESPLSVFFKPLQKKQILEVLSLHVTREHLIVSHHKSYEGHSARAVVLEGLLLAVITHALFNLALDWSKPEVAFLIAMLSMWYLRRKVDMVSHAQNFDKP
ncbi:PrsW family intramembrane metalloprotease [bacterium]|nr:PrsW family intramembrane metalloprotease [bacterium]NCQ54862.1 PrsW family intramembrane metalloprotease [Candidatus Parcubacteria bacterium]NCS66906.1 PrsW family intramembrane metalloprotease [Candidatus Peregrinibacteria bacterium]NCS95852.1 PrsW family intramembrane metalloprotease [bacterium]